MIEEKPFSKKELKTLKNALGKQGLTLDDHGEAKKSSEPCEILHIDCFSIEERHSEELSNGWIVGYGVHYNGVGVSAAGESSVSSEDEFEDVRNPEDADESSGFDSDPSTDDENPEQIDEQFRDLLDRRDSDDVSDKGQLLYGVAEQDGRKPVFFVDKKLIPKDVTVHSKTSSKTFKTGKLVTTNRFPVPATSKECEEEMHRGYQMIGDGNDQCVTSHSEDDDESEHRFSSQSEYPVNSAASSGLWCNFVIAPPDLECKKVTKLEISEEKLKTIPLDNDKLAQISAAMANFKLPTPPGWEGVSDAKIIDFIRQRV